MEYFSRIMLFQPEFQILSNSNIKAQRFEQTFKNINVHHNLAPVRLRPSGLRRDSLRLFAPSSQLASGSPSRSSQSVGWSGREDLNLRPPVPQTGALTGLRYAPTYPRTGCGVRLHILGMWPGNITDKMQNAIGTVILRLAAFLCGPPPPPCHPGEGRDPLLLAVARTRSLSAADRGLMDPRFRGDDKESGDSAISIKFAPINFKPLFSLLIVRV